MYIFYYREKEGTCLANMVAKGSTPDTSPGGGKFIQSFSKSQTSSQEPAAATVDTLLTVHDRVVVSHQDSCSWAIAIGTILSLTCSSGGAIEVRILLDKALPTDSNMLYRIDQAPGFSRGSIPSTLAELCASDSERYLENYFCLKINDNHDCFVFFHRDQRLCELVIDLVPPCFKQQSLSLTHSLLPANLNPSQQDALLKVSHTLLS